MALIVRLADLYVSPGMNGFFKLLFTDPGNRAAIAKLAPRLEGLAGRFGGSATLGPSNDPRALECAQFNVQNLGMGKQVKVVQADLFPDSKADLIVCNPPWLPGKPTSPIERAIYDENSGMLKAYLAGLAAPVAG